MIRVLVVDDSAFMRKMISDLLCSDPAIEVIGTAQNGQEGLEKALLLQPDVITLDIEMPVMDGVTTLEKLMATRPMPVVMLSSLTVEGGEYTLRCLELGAVDFVPKPSGSISFDLYRISSQIIEKVKAAAGVKLPLLRWSAEVSSGKRDSISTVPWKTSRHPLVVIGASTGGPRALAEVFSGLPPRLPASLLIVQHMPPNFTASLASRLNLLSALEVQEAFEGACLKPGYAYLAPGGFHLKLEPQGTLHLSQEPPVHGVRPSVDVTMLSIAQVFTHRVVGVVLTGMGRDGAAGVRALAARGATIIAENEETAVIFGMPKAAIQTGCVHRVDPLYRISEAIVEEVSRAIA